MKRITKSSHNRMVAGVCAGLADYFDIDPTLARIGYVLLGLVTGFLPGLILYFILSAIIPES
jgi:phage shock protein PspC (stress-responsive transcriptional regulator)